GSLWHDQIQIGSERLYNVAGIALGIYRWPDIGLLKIDRGLRDWDDRRLVLALPPKEGTFVKGSGPAIYIIKNGQKRAFPDFPAFVLAGGRQDLANVVNVADTQLSSIPTGD